MTREEEIINQSHKYRLSNPSKNKDFIYNGTDLEEAYESGAKWADKMMIEKACKWLKNNIVSSSNDTCIYTASSHNIGKEDFIKEFRKAMEE